MAKIFLHALSILKKHMTIDEFLGISFGSFCESMTLMVIWSVVTRHLVILLPTGDLCSNKWQAIKAVPCGRWATATVRFVTSSYHCSDELDQQMQL